jgi:hypothetical protein
VSPRSLALAAGIAEDYINMDEASVLLQQLPKRSRSPQQFYLDMIKFKQDKLKHIEEGQRVK